MPPKQTCRNRRKNSAPKRVIRVNDDEENIVVEKNTLVLPKDPNALAKYISERNITEFFELPTVPDVFFDIVQKAKDEALRGKELIFHCHLCKQKVYRSAGGLQYHLMHNCSGVSNELAITCVICGKKYLDSDKVIEHIQDDHVYSYLGAPASEAARRRAARQSRLKIQMFAESSSVAEELERNYSSLSDYDDEKEKEICQENEPVKQRDTLKDSEVPSKQTRGGSTGTYTSIQNPLADAVLWTFKKRELLEKQFSIVHSFMQPDCSKWTLINSCITSAYKLHEMSPAFLIEDEFMNSIRTGKRNSKNVITSKANGKSTMNRTLKKAMLEKGLKFENLKLFHATSNNSHKSTFYVGGPVWSMAWCPLSNTTGPVEQFLALSTHSGEHSLDPQGTYHENVLIQLWNCGCLPVIPDEDHIATPSLAYCLALTDGPIWSMKWCPLSDSVLSLTPKMQRLGILAVACASGDVRLFVLPKPCSNEGGEGAPMPGSVYYAPPHLILRPLREAYFGQCMCVAWSLDDGAGLIAAGFASGHVGVWDLNKQSRFLCGEEEGVRVLYAFHSFRAHSKPVEDVVFCPFESTYVVSVGADRCLKVWDHTSTDMDVPNFLPPKMSILYELDWPLLWCGVYASSDSAFSIPYFHGSIFLNLGSGANTLQNVVPPKAASWSVTGCDWLNSVAGCDVDGSVVINVCNNWNRLFISNKCYPRIVLFQTQVEWNDPSAPTSYLRAPLSFEEGQNSEYNIVFRDCDLSETLFRWKDSEAHLRVRTFEDFADESYDLPVAAVHKVRWNPNLSSFSWIASGTSSGFIRLHCVSGILSPLVGNALNSCRS